MHTLVHVQPTRDVNGEVSGVMLKKCSILWASSPKWIVWSFSNNIFQVGGRELLPEIHASNMALDPSTGLFSVLRWLRVEWSKCKAPAIVKNTGASWLQMEIPAIVSKQSSALMVRRPSGKFVTVENTWHTQTWSKTINQLLTGLHALTPYLGPECFRQCLWFCFSPHHQ